jgi:hypothetical protein
MARRRYRGGLMLLGEENEAKPRGTGQRHIPEGDNAVWRSRGSGTGTIYQITQHDVFIFAHRPTSQT